MAVTVPSLRLQPATEWLSGMEGSPCQQGHGEEEGDVTRLEDLSSPMYNREPGAQTSPKEPLDLPPEVLNSAEVQPSAMPASTANQPGIGGTLRAALAVNAMHARARRRGTVENSEILSNASSGPDTRLTEQQVLLLANLRRVVQDRIQLASNYRSLVGFTIYVSLYFFIVYTQRDTSKTYDVEQSLLTTYIEPLKKSAFVDAPSIYLFLRAMANITFSSTTCGNGVCEHPLEFAGVDLIGCVADCGRFPNTTAVFVALSDTRIPPGHLREDIPLLKFADDTGTEPHYSWNAYSDNLQQWLFEKNVPITGGSAPAVQLNVPDGNLTIRIFQKVQLYGSFAFTPAVISQLAPADPTTTPHAPGFHEFVYGEFGEALGWNVGVKTQCMLHSGQEAPTEPAIPLLTEGLSLPIEGSIMAGTGAAAQEVTVPRCTLSPEQTLRFLNSSNCPLASASGACFDLRAMAAAWTCQHEFVLQIRSYTPPDQPPTPLKPPELPIRYATLHNEIVGAVIYSQRRHGMADCDQSCTGVCEKVRGKVAGKLARKSKCLTARSRQPFGVDPTFLPSSALYTGRFNPDDFFSAEEMLAPGVPFGFFPVPDHSRHLLDDWDFNVYADTRMSAAQALRTIEVLEAGFFVDNMTESASASMLLYNANLGAVAEMRIAIVGTLGGSTRLEYTITSLALDEFSELHMTVVSAVMVTLMALLMMSHEFREAREAWSQQQLFSKYFTDLWNVVDWMAYISVPSSLWVFLWIALELQSSFSLTIDEEGNVPYPLRDPAAEARFLQPDPEGERRLLQVTADFRWFSDVLSLNAAWTAFNVLVLMFRLFKNLDFQGRVGLITRTFGRSLNDIFHFLLLFIFVLVAFAVMGQKLYGRQLPQFKDFGSCLMALVRLTFVIGQDPYGDMVQANSALRSFTALYYLCFFFLSSVVLVNIFLAILLEAFSTVKESASNSETILHGLATIAKYDTTMLQQWALRMLRAKRLGLRFMPDEMLLALLEAWIESERRRGVVVDDAPAYSKKKKTQRWATREEDEEGEEDERVVELADGSRLTSGGLTLLMRSLIESAPEKLQETDAGESWVSLVSNMFSLHRSRVSAEDLTLADDATHRGSSPMATPYTRQASWWDSVRRGLELGPSDPNPSDVESRDAAASVAALAPARLKNRRLERIVRSLMSRYGTDADDEKHHEDELKFWKLEVLQRQLEFFERYDTLESRFHSFLDDFASQQRRINAVLALPADHAIHHLVLQPQPEPTR